MFAGLAFALLLAAVTVCAAEPEVLTVAVFDFESKDEAVRDLGPKVATIVNAALSAEPSVITVERAELEKALGEQELGLSGTVTTESATKFGQLTGAKVLVTGRVFKVDKDTMIVAKVIGTETSRVYGEMVKGGPNASIADLATDLAKKIGATVDLFVDGHVNCLRFTATYNREAHVDLWNSHRPELRPSARPNNFALPEITSLFA